MTETKNTFCNENVIGLYDFRKKRDFSLRENSTYKFQITNVHYDESRQKLKILYLLTDIDNTTCDDVLNEYDTTSYDFIKLIKILRPLSFMVVELTKGELLRTSGICRIKYINNYPIVDLSTVRKDEPYYGSLSERI